MGTPGERTMPPTALRLPPFFSPFGSESCNFSTSRSPCASGDVCRPWGRGDEEEKDKCHGLAQTPHTMDRSPVTLQRTQGKEMGLRNRKCPLTPTAVQAR